jgi:hypothetical protein
MSAMLFLAYTYFLHGYVLEKVMVYEDLCFLWCASGSMRAWGLERMYKDCFMDLFCSWFIQLMFVWASTLYMCVHICYRTLAFNNVVKVSLEFNYSSKIMSFHLKPSLERLFLILLQVNNYFVIRYELFPEYIELRAFRLLNCFSISVSLWFF